MVQDCDAGNREYGGDVIQIMTKYVVESGTEGRIIGKEEASD